jgi:hypothetical protein
VDNYSLNYVTGSISVASTSPHLLVFPTKANFEYTRGELERLNGIFEVPDTLQDSVHLDPILEKFEGTFSGYRSLRQDLVDEIYTKKNLLIQCMKLLIMGQLIIDPWQ